MKIAVLASNFSGNIGDLYILRSVTDFICEQLPDAQLDVFPYPIRFNRRVACAEQINLSDKVSIKPHSFALYGFLDHFARKSPWFEKFLARHYFGSIGRFFRSKSTQLNPNDYDAIVSVGGEMDTPYSFLDIHDYTRNLDRDGKKPFVYGPISLKPDITYVPFLKKLFSGIEKIAIRDPKTQSYLVSNGFNNTQLVPDCAFLSWRGPTANRLNRKRIGLCLHTSWAGKFSHACRVVDQAVAASKALGNELIIYPTHTYEDYQFLNQLIDKYRNTPGMKFVFPNTSSEFITLSQSLDLVISDRLHALLVGMLQGANILPIKTRHKVIGYCEYLQLKRAVSLDDDDKTLFDAIIETANCQELSEKLKVFCNDSHKNVSDFYLTRLTNV
jgi:polysaccharide pyruvyl transferase WcaK-like protein